MRWLQVVNVSRFDRMVSFDVISGAGADVERVEFLAQDEPSARTIAQFLPDTTTGEQRGEAAHERSFEGRLQAIGGQAWVMAVLIGANVVAFVAASRAGGDAIHLDVAVMQKLGADYGPLTTHGQWWRLVTSMFLHFGVAHLWGNMWALWVGGRIVERLYGHLPFLMIYIAAGLCASLCSLLWHPADISAGASGAILGVWGAELAFFLRKDNLVPATIVLAKRYSTMVFIGVNLFYGLTHPGVDNSAHIGGLLAGFVLGLVLERPLIADREATSTPIFYLQGLLVAVLMVGGLFVAVRRWVAV